MIVERPKAFFREQDDGSWFVVIVGNTERTPVESGEAEVITFGEFASEAEAHTWVEDKIGPHGPVPRLH